MRESIFKRLFKVVQPQNDSRRGSKDDVVVALTVIRATIYECTLSIINSYKLLLLLEVSQRDNPATPAGSC